MSMEKQYEFLLRQLEESAASVGVSIEKSGYGLIEVHNRLAQLDQGLEPDDQVEADRLLSEFGKNEDGFELLFALGEACLFAGGVWLPRDDEEAFSTEEDYKSAGWESIEERSLCDFAMYTGIAAATCRKYFSKKTGSQLENVFSHLGRKGALVRHTPMKNLRDWTLAQYKSGNFRSANAAAHALADRVVQYGRTIGAVLSEENAQRTIAEWIRKFA